MSTGVAAPLAVVTAAVSCYVLSLVARRVALATGFVDRPHGYKSHSAPTPYLGGAAVMISLVVAIFLLASPDHTLLAILAIAVGLAVVGAIDDRFGLAPQIRVGVELAAAWLLWRGGVHWSPFGVGPLDFAVSAVWVVGVVNAVNLMDNMDGSASTVVAVSGIAIGVLGLTQHAAELAVAGFALTGACAGFLPLNLAGPAKIFLGDGGSIPLGFLVAALALLVASRGSLHHTSVLAGAMVVGLPILDTALVTFSRLRRGASVVQGGRDHLTHRLRARTSSVRRVALLLAGGQAVLAGVAIAVVQLGSEAAIVAASAGAIAGVIAIGVLETSSWSSHIDGAKLSLASHRVPQAVSTRSP